MAVRKRVDPVMSRQVLREYAEQSLLLGAPAETFRYRLLSPPRIEAGVLYPVIVYLHGAGERGDDNQQQLVYLPELMIRPERRRAYPCFLIAPQCGQRCWWSDKSPGQEISFYLEAVMAMLDAVLSSQPADPERVYATGISMGGFGVWDLAGQFTDRLAAAVPICGGGAERTAPRLTELPIWAWHGDQDEAVPVRYSRRMIEAIRQAGGHPRYTELKGVGHDSWTPVYENDGLMEWMFAQRRTVRHR